MLRWMTAPPVRYGAAVFAVAIALAVRIAFDPWLGDRSAYMTHIVAITAIALWVGRGPAILAALLGIATGPAFLRKSLGQSPDIFEVAMFGATAAGIILMSSLIRRSTSSTKLRR